MLLLTGFYLIKRGREQAHKRTMLSALAVSVLFLTCYVIYHVQVGRTDFVGPPLLRTIYLSILFPHIVLAVTVPPLALTTIYFGLTDQRARAQATGPLDVSDLAVRLRDRRDRLPDAVSGSVAGVADAGKGP